MHTIMNTYCACIQKGAPGWALGVIDDGLGKRIAPSPTLIFSCCQRKALSFSVHLESHHTTQYNSLYTTAITQYSRTSPMSIYPSALSRWRQQSNYSEHDLSMRHELHQNFSQVLSLYGKYDSFLMGIHWIQERQVGVVSKERPSFNIESIYWPLISVWREERKKEQQHEMLYCFQRKEYLNRFRFTWFIYLLETA